MGKLKQLGYGMKQGGNDETISTDLFRTRGRKATHEKRLLSYLHAAVYACLCLALAFQILLRAGFVLPGRKGEKAIDGPIGYVLRSDVLRPGWSCIRDGDLLGRLFARRGL